MKLRSLRSVLSLIVAAALGSASTAVAYPLDGYKETGITRLDAYWLARQVIIDQHILPKGIFWKSSDIKLRLLNDSSYTLPQPDPELSAKIKALLGSDWRDYGVALLDYTDPKNPRYAAVNPNRSQNPASVGKITILLGWFQALADLYPDDIDARMKMGGGTKVTADGFIQSDRHLVPFWKPGDPKVLRRPIEEGETDNLWTYMDWMISASSSAAAGMMMKELMLLNHFGKEYPVSSETSRNFFENTPKPELVRIFRDSIQTPLRKNDLDPKELRQGKFFTREGKRRVPSTANSIATARELLRFIMIMEEGKLVDPWSSLEIKKILYLTDARIRYAASPALDNAAVYYKSGSLYGCRKEPGFECEKYRGNRINNLNSMAIVETDQTDGALSYAVVVLSNVLRKDSSEQHQTLAAEVHALIRSMHASATSASAP
ncbi:MAG: serine hydrolase [Myxococcota bacterium]